MVIMHLSGKGERRCEETGFAQPHEGAIGAVVVGSIVEAEVGRLWFAQVREMRQKNSQTAPAKDVSDLYRNVSRPFRTLLSPAPGARVVIFKAWSTWSRDNMQHAG